MPFVLAVDYDDTLFSGGIEAEGTAKEEIINKVKEFKENGAEIVLWTCREGSALEEAVSRCKDVGLEFDSINENSPSVYKYVKEKEKTGEFLAGRKILADFYVDDKAYNLDFFLKIKVKETCDQFAKR
jgi:hydroxymethylpyrimidine pyrophosphatase-like HAD family hydrolase